MDEPINIIIIIIIFIVEKSLFSQKMHGFRKGPRRLRLKYIHKIKRKKGIVIKNYIKKLKTCRLNVLILADSLISWLSKLKSFTA